MAYAAALKYGKNLVSFLISDGQQIKVGSHAKDDVFAEGLAPSLLTLTCENDQVIAKMKRQTVYSGDALPTDKPVRLGPDTDMSITLSRASGLSRQSFILPYNGVFCIGRSAKNDICIKKPFISGNHLVIRVEAGTVHVEDRDSSNGSFLNGHLITAAKMQSGDVLSLLTVKITLRGRELQFENVSNTLSISEQQSERAFENATPDAERRVQDSGDRLYRRSPRTQEQLPKDDIVIDDPPPRLHMQQGRRSILGNIIGQGASVAAYTAMGVCSPALLAARAAGLIGSSIANGGGSGKRQAAEAKKAEQIRHDKYTLYASEQRARIEQTAKRQKEIISRENPSPHECVDIVVNMRRNLWERMPEDRDFGCVRLGMGYDELCANVKTKSEAGGFRIQDDELQRLADSIIEESRIVDNVPALLDLRSNTAVGIVGDRGKAMHLLRNMLAELATMHSAKELKLVGIFDKEEQGYFRNMRWLPHIWDDDRQSRMLAFDTPEHRSNTKNICETLNEIIKERLSRASENKSGAPQLPQYLIILGSRRLIECEPVMEQLVNADPMLGISTIFMYDELFYLPPECGVIIDMNDGPSVYHRKAVDRKRIFTVDRDIHSADFELLARSMFSIRTVERAGSAPVPSGISFLGGYGVKTPEELNVLQRWRSAHPEKSLAAPIGLMSGGKQLVLDIHDKADGPHGLAAGTTGSGKSELLISWILSMAVNYSPYDINFVLIDFKGSGMADGVKKLPHVVGTLTNLDSNVERVLMALDSENKRRERIFSENGVNHIDDYMLLYHSGRASIPLPHLIIVADEFAELKSTNPEAMKSMVSIARVGRSLGVNLLLATQTPAGNVDGQIMDNSHFRICLKMMNASNSRDMLGKPDASYITQPGRAYLQVGNDERFELFQSFWCGAPYSGEDSTDGEDLGNQVRIIKVNGERKKSAIDQMARFKDKGSNIRELEAVRAHIVKTAAEAGFKRLPGPWQEELPDNITLEELGVNTGFDGSAWTDTAGGLAAPIGKYDAPMRQTQGVQYIDLERDGHLGIYGAPGSGKSTLLKTLAVSLCSRYSPDKLNLYIIDNKGSVSVLHDMPHTGGVVFGFDEEAIEKLEKLLEDELARRVSLMRRNEFAQLKKLPAIVLLADDIDQLLSYNHRGMDDFLRNICMAGTTFRIYVVFTSSGVTGILNKLQTNFIKSAIALELADKSNYSMIVGRLSGVPAPSKHGRAVIKGEPPIEFQTAFYCGGNDDDERSGRLIELAHAMSASWKGARPKAIPIMPEYFTSDDMARLCTDEAVIPLGYAVDDISTACANMKERFCFLVTGEKHCGKSAVLRSIAHIASSVNPRSELCVLDSGRGGLAALQDTAAIYARDNDAAALSSAIDSIVTKLSARLEALNTVYETSLYIFIDDLMEFIVNISNEDRASLLDNLTGGIGAYVIAAGCYDDIYKLKTGDIFTAAIVAQQNGLGIGETLTPSTLSFFAAQPDQSQKYTALGAGIGMLYEGSRCRRIKLAE